MNAIIRFPSRKRLSISTTSDYQEAKRIGTRRRKRQHGLVEEFQAAERLVGTCSVTGRQLSAILDGLSVNRRRLVARDHGILTQLRVAAAEVNAVRIHHQQAGVGRDTSAPILRLVAVPALSRLRITRMLATFSVSGRVSAGSVSTSRCVSFDPVRPADHDAGSLRLRGSRLLHRDRWTRSTGSHRDRDGRVQNQPSHVAVWTHRVLHHTSRSTE